MFGFKRKPKHVHTWSEHITVQFLVGILGQETLFSTVCVECGHSGRYEVEGFVKDEKTQRLYSRLAMKNGWFE